MIFKLHFTYAFLNMHLNKTDALFLIGLCNLTGMCERLWAVLKDQDTAEMWRL